MAEDLNTELLKSTAELVKAATAAIRPTPDDDEGQIKTRSGPLQVIGRLYVSIIIILAASASAGAYIDLKVGHGIATSTLCLRFVLILSSVLGLAGGGWLLWYLVKKRPSLMFSPTEYSPAVHPSLMAQDEHPGLITSEPTVNPQLQPPAMPGDG